MASAARPTGVTITAILAIIGGIWQVAVGLGWALPGGVLGGMLGGGIAPGAYGGLIAQMGFLTIMVGALSIVAGFGMWRLSARAWMLTAIVAWTSIALTILSVIGWGTPLSELIGIALPAVILYGLSTPAVKAAFGRA